IININLYKRYFNFAAAFIKSDLTFKYFIMQELQIDLIDGNFTASDAMEIITSVLDKKMNFHKLQRLAKTERDHADPCTFENERIAALQSEKDKAISFLGPMIQRSETLSIKSEIKINKN
ncbi:hypothetical protein, partial [Nonlabens ulvanivorans]